MQGRNKEEECDDENKEVPEVVPPHRRVNGCWGGQTLNPAVSLAP